ncbi:MAG TPA: metal-dependent hydrolase [Acidimicrobiales bacterium]|nr:metal-dependent hydrolase [Acidimicrobiales bacterium]
MSWAAHEFENYLLQKEFTREGWTKPSFLAIVFGTFGPDILTKFFVYGAHDEAARVHRDVPGLGWSHSFLFGVFLAVLVLWFFKSRAWAIGIVIGQWAHVLTDMGDSAGVLPFFPFSMEQVTIGLWTHSAQEGRYGDAAAYYSGPAIFWDLAWMLLTLALAWRALTSSYFKEVVMPADPRAWGWLRDRLHLPQKALLMIYRGIFFYGLGRMISWFLFARFDHKTPFQPVWGGPEYVEGADLSDAGFVEVAIRTTIGGILFFAFLYLCWRLFGKRLWDRGVDPPVMRGDGGGVAKDRPDDVPVSP